MYKFFVNEEQIVENQITIIGQDVNHIQKVLRLEIGEAIYIGNKETAESYECRIKEKLSDSVICEILKKMIDTNESSTYIHIFQGLPKADKMEWIIEKCTEIGVKEITPVIMKRTIVKLDEKDKLKKIDRWQKIAEVASKQSKRDCILKINTIINFKNLFENLRDYDIVLVAYENEHEKTLKDVLKTLKNREKIKIAVIIGPEGGIDEEEIKLSMNHQAIPVTLGKTILRTETAPLVIASNILYELED